MISMFALGSDLPEIEVIRSALSEIRKFEMLTHIEVSRAMWAGRFDASRSLLV